MTATLFLQCFVVAQLALLFSLLVIDAAEEWRRAWGQP